MKECIAFAQATVKATSKSKVEKLKKKAKSSQKVAEKIKTDIIKGITGTCLETNIKLWNEKSEDLINSVVEMEQTIIGKLPIVMISFSAILNQRTSDPWKTFSPSKMLEERITKYSKIMRIKPEKNHELYYKGRFNNPIFDNLDTSDFLIQENILVYFLDNIVVRNAVQARLVNPPDMVNVKNPKSLQIKENMYLFSWSAGTPKITPVRLTGSASIIQNTLRIFMDWKIDSCVVIKKIRVSCDPPVIFPITGNSEMSLSTSPPPQKFEYEVECAPELVDIFVDFESYEAYSGLYTDPPAPVKTETPIYCFRFLLPQ